MNKKMLPVYLYEQDSNTCWVICWLLNGIVVIDNNKIYKTKNII